ncbi:LysR family transcriptional regulator [Caballeronia novacaledonica]|uniref:LysR family transcriptional regulator n=1 Tax=Caballeronia novacaledonica TaxID=1544861 RepID=A0AA37IHG3_9BURK|nr:LysR family transcriptional regulator [Caballeronia novacaledonica]GJH29393.1 LysR family transcriptional regulator [Caballeronia novacaledonica]
MDNFDLNLLRVLDAIQRHAHLGRAAEELGISQPSVSYALKQLREHLGDPLFVKVHHGMEPTPRTRELIPVVQSILGEVRERILTTPGFDAKTARRTFTLAMSDVGEMVFLPTVLNEIAKEAPHIDVRTVSSDPKDLMAALQRSEVDLAVGYFPDLQGGDIFQQRLFRHGFVCLVRSGHPVLKSGLTRKNFQSLPHAVVHAEGRSQEIVEQFLRAKGIERREMLRSPHFLSIPMVIATTDLVVTVPAAVAEVFAQFADIKAVEPPYPMPSFDLKQHWHRSQHHDPGNQWLRSLVLALFGDGENGHAERDATA